MFMEPKIRRKKNPLPYKEQKHMDWDLFGHLLHSINFTTKSKIAHASQIYILPLTVWVPQSFVVCKRYEWEDAHIQYMKYLQRRQKIAYLKHRLHQYILQYCPQAPSPSVFRYCFFSN